MDHGSGPYKMCCCALCPLSLHLRFCCVWPKFGLWGTLAVCRLRRRLLVSIYWTYCSDGAHTHIVCATQTQSLSKKMIAEYPRSYEP